MKRGTGLLSDCLKDNMEEKRLGKKQVVRDAGLDRGCI